jgi:hypothetical protein
MTTDGVEVLADLGQPLVKMRARALTMRSKTQLVPDERSSPRGRQPAGGVVSKPLSTTFAVGRRSAERDRR